jgi:hypothetical protein
MKILKLLIVLILVSLQAGATGYSHNMLVAQKVLKSKKVSKKSEAKPVRYTYQHTVVKPTPCSAANSSQQEGSFVKPESAAASFSQCIARWIVRVVSINGQILEEKFVSLFADEKDVEKELPSNVRFLSLSENIVYYLATPLRTLL